MVLQSLQGLPAFIAYFCLAAALVIAFLLIYTHITPINEFELIRNNVPGAAISLGLSLLGFALPLASAIAHAVNLIDCAVWGVVALVVQLMTFYVARVPIPDLSARISRGDLAPAIWLGLSSLTAGLLSAASMAL
jgi:putative membrane protein